MDRPTDTAACDAAWVAAAQMYERMQESDRQSSSDARALGQKLLVARGLTPHGLWLARLGECGIHVRTAQRAMSLALGKASQKRHGVAFESGAGAKSGGASGAPDSDGFQKRHGVAFESGATAKNGGAGGAPESDEFICDMLDEDGGSVDELDDDGDEEDGDPVRPAAVGPLARQLDFAEMYTRAEGLRARITGRVQGLMERVGRGDAAAMAELEQLAGESGVGRG